MTSHSTVGPAPSTSAMIATTHRPAPPPRTWFSEDVFRAILRLRGMEANAPSRHAEAFYCTKMSLV
jgi:hypothetical protein